MWRYRYCTKGQTPSCRGMEFPYPEYSKQKYCKWCAFAGKKSKMATGQCVYFNSKKKMEKLRGFDGQWQCKRCGHVTIQLYRPNSGVLTLGRIRP